MKNSGIKKLILVGVAALTGLAASLGEGAASAASDRASKAVTFSKDVAPILQKRCEECHRSGGVAPMSFATYEQARPWARAIKERVVKREMPPFHALGVVGRYHEDPRLTDAEIATIRDWVDGGATKGDPKLMPAPMVWQDRWAFGQPDLVVSPKRPFTLKKDGKDLYVFFVFDHVFAEDTWISSVQVRPGAARNVHHANVHLVPANFEVPPEGYIAGDFDPSARGTYMISGWVPGSNAVKLDEGTSLRLPKGMKLGIQIHYAPTDQDAMDQTQVGLYFANGVINKHIKVLFGDRKDLVIQPGQAEASFIARKTFPTDAVIKFFHVHMHLRGKSYVMNLHYPDGRVETALEVQNYNFNWQRTYILKEPLKVPKGTVVEYIGTYDNSAKNKLNPDPNQTVRWGEFTVDEMMQGRIFYEAVDENLNLRVVKGRAAPASEAARK